MKVSVPVLLIAALAIAGLGGCSPKAKLDRHIANAERYRAEGKFDAAEIEWLNVQRLDSRSGRALAGLGALYLEQGSLTKALPRLLAAREIAPDNLEARAALARAFVAVGKTSDARTEALYILERRGDQADALQILAETSTTPAEINEARSRLSSDNAAAHVGLALLYFREGNDAGAADQIERALALDPTFAPGYAAKATLHIRRREPEDAETAMVRAAGLAPARSPVRLALARLWVSRGKADAARQSLRDTLKEAPDFVSAAIMLADLEAGSGSPEEAQKLLNGVLQRDAVNPEATFLSARLHMALGENTAAIEQLEQLATRFPDSALAHFMLAQAYAATNDLAKAQASLTRTLQLAPDHAEAVLMRAALQVRTGDTGAAIPALRELVKKHPELSRARILLADALRTRGQPDDALQVYKEAIEASPQDAQLWFFAGILNVQLGRPPEARRSFEHALALQPSYTACVEQLVALDLAANDPGAAEHRADEYVAKHADDPDAYVLVAKVAAVQRNADRAEGALQKAIALNPEGAAPYLLLAQVYLSSQRQEQALANLRTATEKNPRDVSALMLMGILLQQKGDRQAARATYEKLLQANPRFVPALNNLAYLCSESFGELDRAYELANRARELRPNDPIALDTFGWILFQRREYAWAASVLTESAAKLGSNSEVQYHLGMTRYMLGDEDGARAALMQALAGGDDFPGKDKAIEHLAILNLDVAQATDEAAAKLRGRLSAVPDDPVAVARLASVLNRRGEADEAARLFEGALKAHPESTAAMLNLAAYHLGRPGGGDRALDLARAAYKTAPDNVAVIHLLGRAAFATGDHVWAASLLREASRRNPAAVDIQVDLARAAYATGSVNDAIAAARKVLATGASAPVMDEMRALVDLTEALESRPISVGAQARAAAVLRDDPNYAAAHMISAAAFEDKNDFLSAAAAYDEVLAAFPHFAPALKRLAALLAAETPPGARALEVASKAREALPNDSEVAAILGSLHLQRGEFARAATLLGEAVRDPGASAETYYRLGTALLRTGDQARARVSLQKALELGLSGDSEQTARSILAKP